MQKRLIALFVLLILTMGMMFVGCGQQAQQTPAQVTLDILAYGDNSTREGQDWNRLVAEFQAANPGIRIRSEMLFDQAYHQKVEARLAAGDVPDIAYMWVDALGQAWRDSNQFVDHRPFLDPNFYDLSLIDPMGPNGEIFQVPLGTSNITSVLFVNTALLAELGLSMPRTYAEMVAMVPVARAAGKEVIAFAGAEGWVWNSCLLGTVVGRLSGNANWVSEAMSGRHRFTDRPFVDSLAFLRRMVTDGVLTDSVVLTDYGAALSNFINGNALFMLDGQWRAGGIEDPAFQRNVQMIPFPALPGEVPAMANSASGVTSVGYGITRKGASNPAVLEAALKFLEFFNSPANVTTRLVDGAIVAPVLRNFQPPANLPLLVAEKANFMNRMGATSNVVDAFVPGEANNALNTGMQNIAIGRATAQDVAAQVERLARQ
jgi:raffinose/stachyose/melibiose transport system substrate-binding protein